MKSIKRRTLVVFIAVAILLGVSEVIVYQIAVGTLSGDRNTGAVVRDLAFVGSGLINLSLLWWAFRQITGETSRREAAQAEIASIAQFPEENPSPVLRIGSEGQVIYTNEAAQALLTDMGWRAGQSIPGGLWEKIRSVFDTGEFTEFDLTCPQGWNFSFACAGKPAKGYVNVYGREITQRKRAEEALRESEGRYRTLVTASSEVLYRMTPDWSEMRQLHSRNFLTNTETPNRHWLQEYIPPEDQPHVTAVIQEAIRTKSVFQLEHRVRQADGSVGWTFSRAVPLMNAHGEIAEWFGAASDITGRKQAEEEARLAVERYERQVRLFEGVVSTTPDFVYLFDRQGRFQYANRRLLEVWGMKLSDVIGKTCRELGYEQWHHDMHMREIAQVIGTKQPIKGEVPFKAPRTGIFGVYEYIFTPVLGSDGEVELIAGTTRDVTDRRRAEEALRQSEATLNAVLDALPLSLIISDANGRLVRLNKANTELWGGAPETTKVEEYDKWVGYWPKTGQRIKAHEWPLARALRTGEVVAGKLAEIERFDNREHRFVLINAAPVRDDSGKIIAGVVTQVDITERRRIEEALRESELFYRQTLESIPGMVFTTRPDGYCDYQSQQWVEFTGIPMGEHLGDGWNQLLHPEDRDQAYAVWRAAVEGRADYDLEYRVRRHDGTYRWFKARGRPIRNLKGRIIRWFGVAMDIHDMKTAEAALRQTQEQLAQTNTHLDKLVQERTAKLQEMVAELEHFSYTITHDMRAPLRAMQGFGNVLLGECADCISPMRRDMIRRIADAAGRMDALITDALNFSKIVRHQFDLLTLDTGALLRGIIESYPQFQPPNAEVVIAPEIPLVVANEAGLTQVFSNLLGNAVKFVAPGTTPRVRVWAETRDGFVRLWFEDNGIGIEPKYHDKIWEMFQRLSKSREGTGIGLALVKKAVERMSGQAGVESEPGKGSRFWVELRRG